MSDQQSARYKLDQLRTAWRSLEGADPATIEMGGLMNGALSLIQAFLLLNLAKDLGKELDEEKILGHILEKGMTFTGAENVSIGLIRGPDIDFVISKGEQLLPDHYRLSRERGLTGWAIQNRQTVRTGDVYADPRPYVRENYEAQMSDTRSELDVPLIHGDDVLGVLNVESPRPNAFDEIHESFLESLASLAANQIYNAQVLDYTTSLLNAAQKLFVRGNTEELLPEILYQGMDLVGADEGAIGLVIDNEIRFHIAVGPNAQAVLNYINPVSKGLTGRAVREKRVVRVNNTAESPDYDPQISKTRSEMDVPIIYEGEAIGVLNFESPQEGTFSAQEEKPATVLAILAGLAIHGTTELEATRVRLRAAEEMALIGDSTATLVHMLNNKIGALRAYAFDIVSDADDISKLKHISNRIKQLCDELLAETEDFRSRYRGAGEPASVDLREIIVEAVKSVVISPEVISDYKAIQPNIRVKAHPKLLMEVFRNLIWNASRAMSGRGELRFTLEPGGSGKLHLYISDTGPGIPEGDWERIFVRGYSTKPAIEGQKVGGLGLWWTRTYLTRINGRIWVKSSNNQGTTMAIELPTAPQDEVNHES